MTSTLPRTPDGVARIAFNGALYGEPWTNIFHVHFDTFAAATLADLNSFVDAMAGDYNTRIMPVLDNGVSFTNATATLFLASPDTLETSRTYSYVGTVATDAESNQACYVLSWRIAASYRGGKPRSYLPGVTEEFIDNHRELTPGAASGFQVRAEGWRTDIHGAGGADLSNPKLGCVSYRSGNLPRSVALFREFTGVVVHPRLGTQRRRLGKWRP